VQPPSHRVRQGERAHAVSLLRRALHHLAPDADPIPLDGQDAAVQVDVAPTQRQSFPVWQPAVQHKRDQMAEALLFGGRQYGQRLG